MDRPTVWVYAAQNLETVHAMTVSRWERGTQKIPPYLLLALERLEQRATTEREERA